jgi:hypothetical protein
MRISTTDNPLHRLVHISTPDADTTADFHFYCSIGTCRISTYGTVKGMSLMLQYWYKCVHPLVLTCHTAGTSKCIQKQFARPLTSPCEVTFAKFEKNAITGLFPGSSCFTVPIFVHMGLAGSERQGKT